MTKRTPDQERAPATNDPAIVSPSEGEQLLLAPEFELVPQWPAAGTLAEKALLILATGEGLTVPGFIERHHSWRLSAYVLGLKKRGWQVINTPIGAPVPGDSERQIARYRLAPSQLAIAAKRGGE
jgi:hypothetical protein